MKHSCILLVKKKNSKSSLFAIKETSFILIESLFKRKTLSLTFFRGFSVTLLETLFSLNFDKTRSRNKIFASTLISPLLDFPFSHDTALFRSNNKSSSPGCLAWWDVVALKAVSQIASASLRMGSVVRQDQPVLVQWDPYTDLRDDVVLTYLTRPVLID